MPRIKVNSTAYFELETRPAIHSPHEYFSIYIQFKRRNKKMQDFVVFRAYGSLPYLVQELEKGKMGYIGRLKDTDPNRADRFANAFDQAIAYCKLQHTLLN